MEINNTQKENFKIGKNIAIARKKLNLSQSELSRQLDLSRGVCGRWERGLANPPLSQINKIAQILKVSSTWLLGNSDIEIDDEINQNIDKNILKSINKLNLEQKQAFAHLLTLIS